MIPRILYGTAWKEERTATLVQRALAAGFRGIDTANQRKHYFEAAVGEGIRASGVPRDKIFLQTKFTFARGQDHRLPYDPQAPIASQVRQSLDSSLEHLDVDRLDAVLLHGPSSYPALADADREAWGAMEDLQREGQVRAIGISNVLLGQLRELHAIARVKPTIVQNRTWAMPDADRGVRAFCAANDITYEGFSLLTAIPAIVAHPILRGIATRAQRTPADLMLHWCTRRRIVVLTGTTSPEHMAQDLAAIDASLSPEDDAAIARLVGEEI